MHAHASSSSSCPTLFPGSNKLQTLTMLPPAPCSLSHFWCPWTPLNSTIRPSPVHSWEVLRDIGSKQSSIKGTGGHSKHLRSSSFAHQSRTHTHHPHPYAPRLATALAVRFSQGLHELVPGRVCSQVYARLGRQDFCILVLRRRGVREGDRKTFVVLGVDVDGRERQTLLLQIRPLARRPRWLVGGGGGELQREASGGVVVVYDVCAGTPSRLEACEDVSHAPATLQSPSPRKMDAKLTRVRLDGLGLFTLSETLLELLARG